MTDFRIEVDIEAATVDLKNDETGQTVCIPVANISTVVGGLSRAQWAITREIVKMAMNTEEHLDE